MLALELCAQFRVISLCFGWGLSLLGCRQQSQLLLQGLLPLFEFLNLRW